MGRRAGRARSPGVRRDRSRHRDGKGRRADDAGRRGPLPLAPVPPRRDPGPAAPDWLRAPFGYGAPLLHLDLHPINVLLSPRGPVVIDWEGAGRGPAEADLAICWVLVALSSGPGSAWQRAVGRAGQRLFANAVLRHAGLRVDDAWLAQARRVPVEGA